MCPPIHTHTHKRGHVHTQAQTDRHTHTLKQKASQPSQFLPSLRSWELTSPVTMTAKCRSVLGVGPAGSQVSQPYSL